MFLQINRWFYHGFFKTLPRCLGFHARNASGTNGTPPTHDGKSPTGSPIVYLDDDAEKMHTFLKKYDTLLLDCDGVLWSIDHFTKFDGISYIMEKFRSCGKRLLFVTNNSKHARHHFLQKFQQLGNFDASEEDVFCTAYAAASYLKNIAQVKKYCYMIGSEGMKVELDIAGIQNFGFGRDTDPVSDQMSDILQIDLNPDVEAILVGFDIHFSYNKILKAASYLRDPDCHYVATNDVECRVELGPRHVQPLSGCFVNAVSASCRRQPVIVGKPHRLLMDCVQLQHPNIDLARTVMIGDSMRTDIPFAQESGLASLLVMSGATNKHQLEAIRQKSETEKMFLPNYVISSLTKFAKYL